MTSIQLANEDAYSWHPGHLLAQLALRPDKMLRISGKLHFMPIKAILTAKNADCQLNPSKLCLNIALSASEGCRNALLLDLHLAAKVFVEKVKSGHNKHSDNKNVKGEGIHGKL